MLLSEVYCAFHSLFSWLQRCVVLHVRAPFFTKKNFLFLPTHLHFLCKLLIKREITNILHTLSLHSPTLIWNNRRNFRTNGTLFCPKGTPFLAKGTPFRHKRGSFCVKQTHPPPPTGHVKTYNWPCWKTLQGLEQFVPTPGAMLNQYR